MTRHPTGNNIASASSKRSLTGRSVVIQITTTPQLVEILDLVVETGFFGTSRASAAERLLSEAVRSQLKEGTIQKRQKAIEQ